LSWEGWSRKETCCWRRRSNWMIKREGEQEAKTHGVRLVGRSTFWAPRRQALGALIRWNMPKTMFSLCLFTHKGILTGLREKDVRLFDRLRTCLVPSHYQT
jgi:hypothetical protein